MAKGERMLSARIRSVAVKRPSTRIGVFGYSQGAGVASRTMRALSARAMEE
jgi:predicted esterase